MIEFLKIVHFLSLAVGIGGGVANGVIGAKAARAAAEVRPVLGGISGLIGRLSGAALILLWLSGIALVYLATNGWSTLAAAFWVKLAFVVVLSAISLYLNLLVMRAQKTRTPPPAATMKRLGQIGGMCSVFIVISAVIAFTG